MSGRFRSPAWKNKLVEGSDLTEFFEMLPDCGPDGFDKETLLILGCLWCGGTPEDKARVFQRIVNNPTQTTSAQVAANDKDFKRVFNKMFLIATQLAMDKS